MAAREGQNTATSWPVHAMKQLCQCFSCAVLHVLKINYSTSHGSILMRFGSLEPPQFILLGLYFSGIDDFAMFRSEKYMSTTPRFRLFILL